MVSTILTALPSDAAFEAALRDLFTVAKPELLVIAAFVLALLYDLIARPVGDGAPARGLGVGLIGIVGFLAALGTAWYADPHPGGPILGGLLNHPTGATGLLRMACLAVPTAALAVAMCSKPLRTAREGEFYLLMIALGLGMSLLSLANNLLLLYLALEMTSLLGYMLAGYTARSKTSSEAGLKYMVFGAFASGVMLLGISFCYALSGSLELDRVRAALFEAFRADAGVTAWLPALIVVLLLLSGLLYKIAAFPFHMWSPDVYEGAPTATAAFLSVGPKLAGFAALWNVLQAVGAPGIWSFMVSRGLADHAGLFANDEALTASLGLSLAVIAVATMTFGNLLAMWQQDAKRMLAFSSIAHSGYILAAFAVLTLFPGAGSMAQQAVLLYLIVYVIMNLGAFSALIGLENLAGGTRLEQMKGMLHRAPSLVVAMGICLFSLVGLPPLAGFVGKWFLLRAFLAPLGGEVTSIGWILAGAVVLNSVISLFYYVKLLGPMIFEESLHPGVARAGFGTRALSLTLAGLTLLLGLYWAPIVALIDVMGFG